MPLESITICTASPVTRAPNSTSNFRNRRESVEWSGTGRSTPIKVKMERKKPSQAHPGKRNNCRNEAMT
jgi:hypothetical protein